MKHVLAAASVMTLLAAAPAWAQVPPASAFGRLPAIEDAELSPNGATVAIIGGAPGRRVLSMSPLDAGKAAQLDLGDFRVQGVSWVGNDMALLSVVVWDTYERKGYNFGRNILVGSDARAGATLLQGAEASAYQIEQPVLGVTSGSNPSVMVQGIEFAARAIATRDSRISSGGENPYVTVVWKVATPSGKGEISEQGSPLTDAFQVDRQGEARVRLDSQPGGDHRWKVRAKGQTAWRDLPGVDEDGVSYRGYSDPDDAVLLNVPTPGGGYDIVRVALADDKRTVLASIPPDRDGALQWDETRMAPIGLVTERDTAAFVWFDPEIGAAHAVFAKAFKGKRVMLRSWSDDRARFVASVEAPDAPPVWYLYDKPRKELSPLGEAYPELAGVPLGKTRFLTYKARDGLEIPAFLTLPPGQEAAKGLPVVVLPHGGPAARDRLEFDFLVQYLATRGYAVLQPQFRGSSGFGAAFETAGEGEWGGKIQTDLLDGLAALAAEGVVDPKRACIAGASFGGYAALAGASLHPETWRCAVSIAGVSDLGQFLGQARSSYGKDSDTFRQWTSMIGRLQSDKALIAQWSPARQAAAITAPVLLIHGDHDTTVLVNQTITMQRAMQEAKKPAQVVILKDDDHYMSYSATRTQVLEAMGAFLSKHLPVK